MATVAFQSPASGVKTGRSNRLFYSTIAVVMGLTVLGGFSVTYYLRFFDGGPTATLSGGPFTTLLHTHAALFTGLDHSLCHPDVAHLREASGDASAAGHRRRRVGRRDGGRRDRDGPGNGPSWRRAKRHGSAGVPGDSLFRHGAVRGIHHRSVAPAARQGNPQAADAALLHQHHRRGHRRIPGLLPLGPPVFFGVSLVFVVAGVVYDFVSRSRVHKAYIWGGAILVLSIPVRLGLSTTGAWHAFAEMLTR